MPSHIGQSLLNCSEERNRQIAWYIVQLSHDQSRYASALLVLLRNPPQGRRQTRRLEHGRTKLQHQAAQLGAGMLYEQNALFKARTHGLAREALGRLQMQCYACQHLSKFVVQLSRQMAAFLLLDCQQPAREML